MDVAKLSFWTLKCTVVIFVTSLLAQLLQIISPILDAWVKNLPFFLLKEFWWPKSSFALQIARTIKHLARNSAPVLLFALRIWWNFIANLSFQFPLNDHRCVISDKVWSYYCLTKICNFLNKRIKLSRCRNGSRSQGHTYKLSLTRMMDRYYYWSQGKIICSHEGE